MLAIRHPGRLWLAKTETWNQLLLLGHSTNTSFFPLRGSTKGDDRGIHMLMSWHRYTDLGRDLHCKKCQNQQVVRS